jgi:hypothetical protein
MIVHRDNQKEHAKTKQADYPDNHNRCHVGSLVSIDWSLQPPLPPGRPGVFAASSHQLNFLM